jgi:hypothetical protein
MTVTVQCVVCKAQKEIDQLEGAKLSARASTPTCDNCYMPMIPMSAAAHGDSAGSSLGLAVRLARGGDAPSEFKGYA